MKNSLPAPGSTMEPLTPMVHHRQGEDALWQAFLTATLARRRAFEPGSSMEREHPGPCHPLRREPRSGDQGAQRTLTADAPPRPKRPKNTILPPAEEAIAVAFRQKAPLPLDDLLGRLKDGIPNLSRGAPHLG
jgi:hypothetical protein